MARQEKGIPYQTVLKNIKKGDIGSTYLFYGDDLFLADDLIDTIIFKVFNAEKDDFNLHIFYGKESRGEDILNAAMSFPIMAEKKVIILKDIEQLDKNSVESLTDYFKNPHDSTIFVAVSGKADFRKNPFKILEQKAVCVKLEKLNDRDIPDWIEAGVMQKEKKIEPRAAMLMAARSDVSMRDLYNQIEKLCTYIGVRDTINEEDIESVIGISRQYNIFELSNAIGMKDAARAISIFNQMYYVGEQPVGMIVMLHRQFILLWQICDKREAGRPFKEIENYMMTNYRIYPNFFQNDYWPQAQNYSTSEIQSCFSYLLDADVQLKSSSVKNDLIMQKLIFQLIRGNAT
ncbi:DNA polymerase III subunit delta [bacterium]|nr:MAG: DNA polymerase III subunit delta [bacterium]